jgi:hypothetical protein
VASKSSGVASKRLASLARNLFDKGAPLIRQPAARSLTDAHTSSRAAPPSTAPGPSRKRPASSHPNTSTSAAASAAAAAKATSASASAAAASSRASATPPAATGCSLFGGLSPEQLAPKAKALVAELSSVDAVREWYPGLLQGLLPMQSDGVSCGVFVCAFAYFLRFHGRPPTSADYNGVDHHALRLAIFRVLESGNLPSLRPYFERQSAQDNRLLR